MEPLGLVAILVIAYGALRDAWPLAIAVGGSTAAGAVFVHGNLVIYTFYAVAAAAIIAALVKRVFKPDSFDLRDGPDVPGLTILYAFAIWCVGITVLAPAMFNGLTTVTPNHYVLQAGRLSTSNIAQLIYIALGIAVVTILAYHPSTSAGIIGVSLSLAIALSLWRFLAHQFHFWFPDGFLDNASTLVYIETTPGGGQRFRGIFSEPAALAGTAIMAVAWGVAAAADARGARRIPPLLLAAVAVFLGLISTSTTFVVAGSLVTAVAFLVIAFELVIRRLRLSLRAALTCCLAVLVTLWVAPMLIRSIVAVVETKAGTSSFSDRGDVNAASYEVLARTGGLGVGLGSGRASSLIPTLLSTAGIVGTVLLLAAIAQVVCRSIGVPGARPALWVLIALLVTKAVSGPDLSDPTGMLWISLGVLAATRIQKTRLTSCPQNISPKTIGAGSGAP